MTQTPKKQNRLTLKQQLAVVDLLEQHCQLVEGFAVYDEGWDDHKVAQHLDLASPSGVQRIRRELIGDLARGVPGGGSAKAQIADLQTRVAALEKLVEELLERETEDALG